MTAASHPAPAPTALVTGAGRGIGRAIAARLATDGARVTLADNDGDALAVTVQELQAQLPGAVLQGRSLDVTDSSQVNDVVAEACMDRQNLDVLVNCAGILRDGWIDRISDDDWRQVLAVNLDGTFFASRAAVAFMRPAGYGRIVNISSRAWMGNPGQSNYSASKAGVVGLTRALALESVRYGITVNAVAPGMIDSPMTQALKPEVRDRLVAAQPGGRMGQPEEVAAVVAFLASREASFITGQVLNVCGGKSLGMGGVA